MAQSSKDYAGRGWSCDCSANGRQSEIFNITADRWSSTCLLRKILSERLISLVTHQWKCWIDNNNNNNHFQRNRFQHFDQQSFKIIIVLDKRYRLRKLKSGEDHIIHCQVIILCDVVSLWIKPSGQIQRSLQMYMIQRY